MPGSELGLAIRSLCGISETAIPELPPSDTTRLQPGTAEFLPDVVPQKFRAALINLRDLPN